MIKYFLRKTVYKGYDKQSQDMLYYLTSKQYIIRMVIRLVYYLFWLLICIYPAVPLFIITMEGIQLSMTTQIAIAVLLWAWMCMFGVMVRVLKKTIFDFSELLTLKACFMLCTEKGGAIKKKISVLLCAKLPICTLL